MPLAGRGRCIAAYGVLLVTLDAGGVVGDVLRTLGLAEALQVLLLQQQERGKAVKQLKKMNSGLTYSSITNQNFFKNNVNT